MPKQKAKQKVVKRANALKNKPRKGQQLKDEKSMANLVVDIHEMVKHTQPQPQKKKIPKEKLDCVDELKKLNDLAHKSILEKKLAPKINNEDLMNLMSKLDNVSVSDGGSKTVSNENIGGDELEIEV